MMPTRSTPGIGLEAVYRPPLARLGPRLSVIVPAYRCGRDLARCLEAVLGSELPRSEWELIVVDDGSPDETAAVAARYADRVLRTSDGPKGPAAARNLGAAVANGDVLVFVDADVCIAHDALRRFQEVFSRHADVAAAFGAYDLDPAAASLVSRYRNLLHHYVHVTNAGPATTFWAGCGAVRREAFAGVGGFDAVRYPRPQIEDIDLGYRLSSQGHRILLVPSIQGKHLKRWTWRSGLLTDVRDRGVPWMRLMLERKELTQSGPLNLALREKLLTVLTASILPLLLLAIALHSAWLAILAGLSLAAVVGANARLLLWFAKRCGPGFAFGVVLLRLQYYALNAWSATWAIQEHARHVRRRASELAAAQVAAAEAVATMSQEILTSGLFHPLHKRAFGIAVGSALGSAIAAFTLGAGVADPAGEFPLVLLANYFRGYTVSPLGALIGGAYGLLAGFFAGWFTAFVRNAVLLVIALAARAQLQLLTRQESLEQL
jgi:hypothetical protein